MNLSLLLKVAGVGLLVSIAYQIFQKSGRDEQATYITIAGVIIVMLFLINEINGLFNAVRSVFGL